MLRLNIEGQYDECHYFEKIHFEVHISNVDILMFDILSFDQKTFNLKIETIKNWTRSILRNMIFYILNTVKNIRRKNPLRQIYSIVFCFKNLIKFTHKHQACTDRNALTLNFLLKTDRGTQTRFFTS
jgi:hypothetical protein